jgi:flagellar export protein FliJ
MKTFHFSLEPLRVLRQQKEQAAQQKYARVLTACDQAELQLQSATSELAAGWNLLNQGLERGITAARLASLQTWCKVLKIRRNERLAALDETRNAAGLAFREMTLAARDREALDRFYEKSRLAYLHKIDCEEQKTLDELAVQLSSTPGPLQFVSHEN